MSHCSGPATDSTCSKFKLFCQFLLSRRFCSLGERVIAIKGSCRRFWGVLASLWGLRPCRCVVGSPQVSVCSGLYLSLLGFGLGWESAPLFFGGPTQVCGGVNHTYTCITNKNVITFFLLFCESSSYHCKCNARILDIFYFC